MMAAGPGGKTRRGRYLFRSEPVEIGSHLCYNEIHQK